MHRSSSIEKRVTAFCFAAAVGLLCSCATPPTRDALFRSQAALHGGRAAVIGGVPDFARQAGAEEAAAALADVATFWGLQTSYGAIAAKQKELRAGLSAEAAVIAGADALGLWAFTAYGTPDDIMEKVRGGHPIIVILQDASGLDSRHFTVVSGFDDETKQFLCNDGMATPQVYSYEEFLRKWMPVRFWMAVVCTPEAARWKLTPQDLISRGNFYALRNRFAEAQADYEAVLAANPRNDEVRSALAIVLQKSGDLPAAELAFRELRARRPDDTRVANNLAYILARERKSLEEAELIARDVVRREPNNSSGLDTLGYVLVLRKNYKEAIPLLESAYKGAQTLTSGAHREIAVHLALAYLGDRQDELMRKIIADIIAVDPSYELPDELKKKLQEL